MALLDERRDVHDEKRTHIRVEAGVNDLERPVRRVPVSIFASPERKQAGKNSFFGDLHAHGKDAVMFYTEQKVLMTRWF